MALYGVSFVITYTAWDSSAGAPKTGDVANHTLRWIKDGTASAPTNSPSEVDATNAPGEYKVTLTTTEAEAIFGKLAGKSSTADVSIIPIAVAFEKLPNALPGENGGLPTVDANNRIAGMQGALNTLDDLDTAQDTQHSTTQALLGSLSVAAGGLAQDASGATITTGTETNDYTETAANDGTLHIVEPSGGTTDFYYTTTLPAGAVCTKVEWDGYFQSNGDTVAVYFYDWIAADWTQVGTRAASNGSTVEPDSFSPVTKHTGTGANSGQVRLRFQSTTTTAVATDRIRFLFSESSAGIANGSTITLGAATTNTNLIGRNWTLALGGQDIAGAYVSGATSVTGTGTGTNGTPFTFQQCAFGATSLSAFGFIHECAIGGTLTLTSTAGVTDDQIDILSCYSNVAGLGAPTITAAGVTKTTNVNIRGWFGGLTYISTADCTTTIEVMKGGTITITTGGGNVEVRGIFRALNVVLSGAETVQFIGTTGHITLSGTTSGGASTVNLYGTATDVTDNTAGDGATVDDDTLTLININAEVDTAISGAALATASDLATTEGKIDTLLARITSTLFTGITSLAQWLGLMAGKQAPNSTALTEIRATGAGSGTYDATSDSLAAARDKLTDIETDTQAIEADTQDIQGRLPAALTGAGNIKADALAINSSTTGAAQLAAAAEEIVTGTVDTATNTHTPTTTEFQADDITEATSDHYKGKIVTFKTGALAGQSTDITGYAQVGGIGQFTVTALTEAPANDDTFVIT